jgi:hypothetical protein
VGRRDVSIHRVAVNFADDNFFVGRRHANPESLNHLAI